MVGNHSNYWFNTSQLRDHIVIGSSSKNALEFFNVLTLDDFVCRLNSSFKLILH